MTEQQAPLSGKTVEQLAIEAEGVEAVERFLEPFVRTIEGDLAFIVEGWEHDGKKLKDFLFSKLGQVDYGTAVGLMAGTDMGKRLDRLAILLDFTRRALDQAEIVRQQAIARHVRSRAVTAGVLKTTEVNEQLRGIAARLRETRLPVRMTDDSALAKSPLMRGDPPPAFLTTPMPGGPFG